MDGGALLNEGGQAGRRILDAGGGRGPGHGGLPLRVGDEHGEVKDVRGLQVGVEHHAPAPGGQDVSGVETLLPVADRQGDVECRKPQGRDLCDGTGAGTAQEDSRYGKPMHNPQVVFNEDILPRGAALHTLTALRYLERT